MFSKKSRFNHSPFVYGQWVEFNGHRFKNPYMLRLKDGTELPGHPNCDAWAVRHNDWIDDSEVTHVMQLQDNYPDLGHHQMTGGMRIARDIDYFGKVYPVWCGPEHGFVQLDEIPEGKQILPVQIMAHRSKRSESKKITLFVAQGVLVDKADHVADLNDLQKYIDIPGAWPDDNVEILSHSELIWVIFGAARFTQILEIDSSAKELLAYLRDVINLPPNQYVPWLDSVVNTWNNNRDDFKRQMETMTNEDHEKRWKIRAGLVSSLSKRQKEVAANLMRGPKPDMTFDINMLDVSNFIKNPLVLPEQLKINVFEGKD